MAFEFQPIEATTKYSTPTPDVTIGNVIITMCVRKLSGVITCTLSGAQQDL
jgi:hypothetical protein